MKCVSRKAVSSVLGRYFRLVPLKQRTPEIQTNFKLFFIKYLVKLVLSAGFYLGDPESHQVNVIYSEQVIPKF
jgi:hypothetical protein